MPPHEHQHQHEHSNAHHHQVDVAVAVITSAGIYPDEHDFRRVPETEHVKVVLKQAADKFGIKNTDDWVAKVHGRDINIDQSFHEQHLKGIVEILWNKPEGGGGNRA